MNIKTRSEIINYILIFQEKTNIEILTHIANFEFDVDTVISDLEEFLFPAGQMDINAVDRVAMYLGINFYDLLQCNYKRLEKYLDSYEYFELIDEYEDLKEQNENNDKLSLFSFPKIGKLIKAYTEICNDYLELFIQGIKGNLSGRDLELFNFLASVLEAYDIHHIGNDLLNGEILYNFRKVYKKEIEEYAISDIVEFHSIRDLEFWKCIDFVDVPKNIALLDRYASHWRNSVNTLFLNGSDDVDIILLWASNNSEPKPLSENERELWNNNLIKLIDEAPNHYRSCQDRVAYSVSDEAAERQQARAEAGFISFVPPTFDVIDYISKECKIGTPWVNVFYDAQNEFDMITCLDEEDEPEEYEEAMLIYCAGKMGLCFEDAKKMYVKQMEFLENY